MRKLFMLMIAAVATLSFLGCGTPPIYNVSNMPITTTDKKATLDDVEKAIIRAGGALGWSIKKSKEGQLVGTLALRSHKATVKITCTQDEYSIVYIDSVNLDYNPSTNTIHSNYNGWIQNLNKGIQTQLGLL